MLSIYHTKFYLKIRTGSQVILTLFLGFGRPPSLDSKKTGRIKNELALVNQIGSDVIFASHQNIVANFYAILREVRRLRRSFLVFATSKMPPRRCVVQYCSRVSDKELGISMHTSPSSGNIRTKWKDLSLNTEKTSTLPVSLGYARCISKLIVLPVQSMYREPKDE